MFDVTGVTDPPFVRVPLAAGAPYADARVVARNAILTGHYGAIEVRVPSTGAVVVTYTRENPDPKWAILLKRFEVEITVRHVSEGIDRADAVANLANRLKTFGFLRLSDGWVTGMAD